MQVCARFDQRVMMWWLLLCGVLLVQGCLAEPQVSPWRRPDAQGAAGQLDLAMEEPSMPLFGAEPVASQAVEVDCEPDRVVVRAHRDLFGMGKLVAPTDLTLGSLACPPTSSNSAADVVLFEAGLHECGSTMQVTPDWLIYQTSLFYTPSLGTDPVLVRTSPAVIPIECWYRRSDNVTGPDVKPMWTPFGSTASAEGRLGFSLRLMNEDWSADRASTAFQLGDAIHLQAEVHSENHHLPLRVFVDRCVAGVTPEPHLGLQYAVIDSHGCLVDGAEEGVSSAFLSPRPHPDTLRFTIDAFRFAEDPGNLIYIVCHLKVTPITQDPDVLNKACSFKTTSNSWFPVEGPEDICSCCEVRNCDRMPGEEPQGMGPGHQPMETSWQSSTPEAAAASQAHLALGPLFVFDSEDNLEQFLGDMADIGRATAGELVPRTELEVGGTESPVPLKEPQESSHISREPENGPEPPLEVYVRGGPLFIMGAEDGSGVEAPAEPARSENSLALELKAAELTSHPAEEAAPSVGKVPVDVTDVEEKGPERKFSLLVLLLLLIAASTVTFLALGALILMKRCRRRHSESQLSM